MPILGRAGFTTVLGGSRLALARLKASAARGSDTRWTRCLPLAALVLGAVVSASGDGPDPQTLGPKVGERVLEFSLPDQHGVARTLKSAMGPKGAVLVFFRSADW